jgi:hypothetical protein
MVHNTESASCVGKRNASILNITARGCVENNKNSFKVTIIRVRLEEANFMHKSEETLHFSHLVQRQKIFIFFQNDAYIPYILQSRIQTKIKGQPVGLIVTKKSGKPSEVLATSGHT